MIQKLSASVFSATGNYREINQDNYYLNGSVLTDVNKPRIHKHTSVSDGLFAVCDGMGGENDGEIASRLVVDSLGEYDPEDNIREIISKANNKICQHIIETKNNSGSTLVMAAIENFKADIYNIGDSRCYLIRGNDITQLSKDHTMTNDLVQAGKLTEEEAKSDKRRHQLTQHLGIFPEEMSISVYHKTVELFENDILLMCTDGLSDVLTNEEILEIVKDNDNTNTLALELAEDALNNGSKDNVTAMVVKVRRDQKEELIRMLYILICVCSGLIGGITALITLFLL